MRAVFFTLSAVAIAACGEPGDYLVVTIETRPAVHDATTLRVTLRNEGSERTDDLPLGAADFPATFSVSAPGRTGDLEIDVSALDEAGLLVGRGSTLTTLDRDAATVMVDSADFVVNTDVADDQELSNYFAAHGLQLGVADDGTWTAVHSARCSTPCNVFGRRFDSTGRPVVSQIAAGTNGFPVSSKLTTFFSTPVVAAAGSTTLAVWNADDPNVASPNGYSIDCRAFDANGAAMSNQLTISTDEFPNMVAIAPLSNLNFAVVWEGRVTTDIIRSAVVKPDCSVLAPGVLTASTSPGTLGPKYSHVAASADRIMYAWILDGNVRARIATNSNSFIGGTDIEIVAKTATEEVEHVRVAALPGGNFAVFVRWALATGTSGAGRIEMYRTNNAGSIMGPPTTVTTRSGSDFSSKESFGVAAHADGSILVVWSSCLTNGDDSGCGVFGRLMASSGSPAGPEFSLATTTKDDQTGPSAVALPGSPAAFATAWTDASQTAPDTAGAAVRARIIYPPLDSSQ